MRNTEMDGFNLDEDADAAKRRENGSSWPRPRMHAQHRRSKSASERHLEISRDSVLHSVKKEQSETQMWPFSTRGCRVQSPLHDQPKCVNKKASYNHRASLEKDIEQLQLRLQQEKSMRMVLGRAMGRVSSTLSPGHRHFATQAKELIAEIESLEEEVANREQHVLSLCRNVFEQCVSRAPSGHNSVMASPIRAKHSSRKHPSIISSAFCSSKKLPLQPLHVLVSISHSGKKTFKATDAPMFSDKSDHIEKNSSNRAKTHDKVPAIEKASVIRTLKDHLYQCPSKLSEEMVRCMAAVYCWLHSATSVTPEKSRSPLSSRSSTNVILPGHGIGEDRSWCCKSMVEVSWISTDKSQFSPASYAISNYRVLVEQLEKVTVSQMEKNAAHLAYGIPHSSLRRLGLFHKVSYNVGGHIINANAVEHLIFCFRTPKVGRLQWLETVLSAALRKKSGEEKQLINSKFGLPDFQPLVCFALCTGAFSDPMLKVYTVSNVQEELEVAKRDFLQAHVVVKSKKVFLPKVLERFAKEASITSDDLLRWVTENVDKKIHDSIQECVNRKSHKKPSQMVDWLPYSSRFRYVFAKDWTEMPR